MNGWCAATHVSFSSSYSKKGISVIHTKLNLPSGITPRRFPQISLSAPKVGRTTLFLSAQIRTRSPFSAPTAAFIFSRSPSPRNFLNEQFGSSAQRIYARPFAPMPFACSTSLSISFLVYVAAPPLTFIARTEPPASIADLNTTKSISLTVSVISCISMPKRVSGLSEP